MRRFRAFGLDLQLDILIPCKNTHCPISCSKHFSVQIETAHIRRVKAFKPQFSECFAFPKNGTDVGTSLMALPDTAESGKRPNSENPTRMRCLHYLYNISSTAIFGMCVIKPKKNRTSNCKNESKKPVQTNGGLSLEFGLYYANGGGAILIIQPFYNAQ